MATSRKFIYKIDIRSGKYTRTIELLVELVKCCENHKIRTKLNESYKVNYMIVANGFMCNIDKERGHSVEWFEFTIYGWPISRSIDVLVSRLHCTLHTH